MRHAIIRRVARCPLAAGVAIIACACATSTHSASSNGRDIDLRAETREVSSSITAGATLASLLRAYRVADAEAARVIASAQTVFDVRKVRVRQPFRLDQAFDGTLR